MNNSLRTSIYDSFAILDDKRKQKYEIETYKEVFI